MAASLSTVAAKDSAGTAIAGGLLAIDKSGAGSGPFFLGHAIVDMQGVNVAAVKAVSTAPVTATDPALVTVLRPDSPGVMPSAALTAATAPASGIATLAQYNATNPAPTDTQTVGLQVGPNGALLVQPYGNPANFVSGAITSAMTSTTSTSLVAAPASGLRNYITTIICSNAHATQGTDIIIQDGSGGTTLMTIPAAAVYGGAVITLPTPLRQPTTATAIYCANVTSGASTKVSAVGYKGI